MKIDQSDKLIIVPGFRVQERTRGFFDDLLISPLNRTLALIQVNGVAMFVAQNLENIILPYLLLSERIKAERL